MLYQAIIFQFFVPRSLSVSTVCHRSCYYLIDDRKYLICQCWWKSPWQKSIKAKHWVGALVSSGFIIGQDVATLHSSRESNQLRNSNGSEYVEEKAEQGDLIICTINCCVPEIFGNPANLSSQSSASCFPLALLGPWPWCPTLTIWCPPMSFFMSAGSLSVSANVG